MKHMFGGLLWPNVVFSKDGKRIFPDEIQEPLSERVCSASLGELGLEFYKDGFVKIDSPTKEEAIERLNCLILSLKLLRLAGPHVSTFKEDELFTIRKNSLKEELEKQKELLREKFANGEVVLMDAGPEYVLDSGKYASFRSVYIVHEDWRKDFVPLININANELEVIVELAERFYRSPMRPQLITFIEAWTARSETDWNTGFILSWVCIEIMVFSQIVDSYRSDPDAIYQKDKRGKVKTYKNGKKIGLSSFAAIEMLRKGLGNGTMSFAPHDKSAFDCRYLDTIQGLREIRNDIVHGSRRATQKESEDCLQASLKALFRLMRLGGIRDYSNYLDRMDGKRSESETELPDRRIRST